MRGWCGERMREWFARTNEQHGPPEWLEDGDRYSAMGTTWERHGSIVVLTTPHGGAEWVLVDGEWRLREEGDADLLGLGFTFDPDTGLHWDPVSGDYTDTYTARLRVDARADAVRRGEAIIGFDGRKWT